MLGGVLSRKVGLMGTLLISAVLSCCGFLSAGAMGNSILRLYISYGIMAGLGIGIAYNVIISTVNNWFPDRKGLCSGVLMMGFGASALILGSAADYLINSPQFGWCFAYRAVGISLGVVLCLEALILRKAPEADQTETKSDSSDCRGLSTAEMLKSITFWKALLLIIFHRAQQGEHCFLGFLVEL